MGLQQLPARAVLVAARPPLRRNANCHIVIHTMGYQKLWAHTSTSCAEADALRHMDARVVTGDHVAGALTVCAVLTWV